MRRARRTHLRSEPFVWDLLLGVQAQIGQPLGFVTQICATYEEMARKLMTTSKTGEEVMQLKKFYSKCQQDDDKLREDIEYNQERDEYLERFRFPIAEDEFIWAMKAYMWPKKMRDIMKEVSRHGALGCRWTRRRGSQGSASTRAVCLPAGHRPG